MSLTKEDLKALSDLIDIKLDEQYKRIDKKFEEQDKKIDKKFEEQDKRIDKKFEAQDKKIDKKFEEQDKGILNKFQEQDKSIDKKFEEQRLEFKDMLIDNNLLIAEHIQIIVLQSEERLVQEIKEIKNVTADNCYSIVQLRNKIS